MDRRAACHATLVQEVAAAGGLLQGLVKQQRWLGSITAMLRLLIICCGQHCML
jgi:hypothetical protein